MNHVEDGFQAPGTVPADVVAPDPADSKNSTNTQLLRFILVGGLSAVVDFGSTSLFTWVFGLPDATSKTLGFILGTLTAYLLNRRWTFQADPSWSRFAVTMVTYGLTFLVQIGLYLVSIPWLEGMGLNEFWVRLLSFVVAQGTATVLNFLIQKFLIFRT
ncbi:GtrA family protein [Corynebacterium suicordis]|uniref:GtrA family protein n=1 Tax=Corynebacterium suicordis TaxID=203264 RepID=UPI001E649444|nr:GtrA family protein [Corynebacterium suicordis]MDR6278422.1 putative flippase GtrA [Corynebacterium suicordis]